MHASMFEGPFLLNNIVYIECGPSRAHRFKTTNGELAHARRIKKMDFICESYAKAMTFLAMEIRGFFIDEVLVEVRMTKAGRTGPERYEGATLSR
jgi:hypothetical protein